MKPFADSQMVKLCIIEAVQSVVEDSTTRDNIVEKLKEVPLSDSTPTQRTEKLGKHLCDADWFSLAVDESTDLTDKVQLMCSMSYVLDKFYEDVRGQIHW